MRQHTLCTPLALFLLFVLGSCEAPVENYASKIIVEEPSMAADIVAKIEGTTSLDLADGITMRLWATDSLAPDPVAMSIDDFGAVYLTRTNRQKNSEFDIRGHMDWVPRSIALQTVEDRRAFLKDVFATEKSEENEWLKDLNNDSIHDWRDLAVETDEIWKIEDTNNDGMADRSTRILKDFNEEITDVAGALLVRRNDVFVGVGPDMWRIYDRDEDGILDTKESISHGYAVHIGFSGHGMSGAIQGPDGKIYWGIGDIGASITDVEGNNYHYPNQGVLVRSNPDGTDFEVFAAGLRNTHEFAFDQYGNIIGSDNDGDHRGESERLVHIVEGHDAGWRSNWQYGKYTDPKNNNYKVWMDERLYVPHWEGQAAYILPPIKNFHNGPTGLVYNPGTALGSAWTNKFFVVEFVGNAARSPIWSFSLTQNGASFDLNEDIMLARGVLPTGIRFGPDGALYAADWIYGWGTKDFGRVWKIDVTEETNDLASKRGETKRLMALDYGKVELDELGELLSHDDMRIRQKAQFELVDRKRQGKKVLLAATSSDAQLGKIHGIWGMGQLIASGQADGDEITSLLDDSDPEIVTQTLKVLGDNRYAEASGEYISLLEHDNARVKFYAAQALGRVEAKDAVQPLLALLETNDDADRYLRHAGVIALSRIGDVEPILELAGHSKPSMRTAAILVLRRLKEEQISSFLKDDSEYIVTEAARAINDDFSIPDALPALANILKEERFTSEPLIRRAINACSRVGGEQQIQLLVDYSRNAEAPLTLRAEALLTLAHWASPSILDRVDGRYRGEINRSAEPAIQRIDPHLASLLNDPAYQIAEASVVLTGALGITSQLDPMVAMAQNHSSEVVRKATITALDSLDYPQFDDIIRTALNDNSGEVRTLAISYLKELGLSAEELPGFAAPVFAKGTVREQQQLLRILAELPFEQSGNILNGLADQWIGGDLSPEINLELLEAIDEVADNDLLAKVEPHRNAGGILAEYQEALYGGDARRGFGIFNYNSTAQCIRCHAWEEKPDAVGPSMRGVASRLEREDILESMVDPSAKLAAGFGSVILELKDGSSATGILLEESEEGYLLKTSEAEPLEIAAGRVARKENLPSSMPPMGAVLSKREIRDLVAYLMTQTD
ncbi:MAG: HEAT repeat domain-containing protein [Bacteroidota bacterium]